jgi:hypothetical protein
VANRHKKGSRVEVEGQAEEGEEAGGVEEEGEVDYPTTRHLEDLNRPRVVAVAGSGSLVLGECWRTIGDGRDEAGSPTSCAGTGPPREYVVPTL